MKSLLEKSRIADAELMLLIRSRKRHGAELLYDTYANFLFLVIYRIVPQREVAEQVLQATIQKIWCSIEDYSIEKERIYTWMVTIAKELASDTSVILWDKYEKETKSLQTRRR